MTDGGGLGGFFLFRFYLFIRYLIHLLSPFVPPCLRIYIVPTVEYEAILILIPTLTQAHVRVRVSSLSLFLTAIPF